MRLNDMINEHHMKSNEVGLVYDRLNEEYESILLESLEVETDLFERTLRGSLRASTRSIDKLNKRLDSIVKSVEDAYSSSDISNSGFGKELERKIKKFKDHIETVRKNPSDEPQRESAIKASQVLKKEIATAKKLQSTKTNRETSKKTSDRMGKKVSDSTSSLEKQKKAIPGLKQKIEVAKKHLEVAKTDLKKAKESIRATVSGKREYEKAERNANSTYKETTRARKRQTGYRSTAVKRTVLQSKRKVKRTANDFKNRVVAVSGRAAKKSVDFSNQWKNKVKNMIDSK